MALSNEDIRAFTGRLLLSRMRLTCTHGFYGLLLMHMKYAVDEQVETACTDGVHITFGTDFLKSLSDSELDFVMMHEILHVVLSHCLREGERDGALFNVACDIVVNSNIMQENGGDPAAITLAEYGVSMHEAPNGEEGYRYTAEEVYEMLKSQGKKANAGASGGNSQGARAGAAKTKAGAGHAGGGTPCGTEWDDHTRWGSADEKEALRDVWAKRLIDACTAIEHRHASQGCGDLPLFAERLLKELRTPVTDWRTVLNEFVQEEVADYSFSPPDHRFDDTPFFLPDFNGTVEVVRDILFMIDTSGSMSDQMVADAFAEVKGASDQFDGRLSGWLGFFDAAVTDPIPFTDVEEFRVIRPYGGGGTSFSAIFSYVKEKMQEKKPASLIILTDGYAPFPTEKERGDVPVLWVIAGDDVEPPFGRVTHIPLS